MEHIDRQGHLTGSLATHSLAAADWFQQLRDVICQGFEAIEAEADNTQLGRDSDIPAGKFERKNWQRDGGGGGQISVMKGRVFEKVGVNISVVHGAFTEAFRAQIPGAEGDGAFWAGGISLVAHPQNPFVPAAHMNTRFVVTSKAWFGGGGDLTPSMPAAKQADAFHADLQACCRRHDPEYSDKYKKLCDEYFYLPHRNEARGIGGIFFYYETKDWIKNFKFVRELGLVFIDISNKIINRKKNLKYSKKDKEKQLFKRGRYVEFNLLYDRGTKFGLNSGGNIDSILMSLPPEAKWK